MPTGNFDEPLPAPPAPLPAPRRPFRLPSDYYGAPLSEVRPILPKWAPYGCGIAAALFLALLFVAAALLSGERLRGVLAFVIGTSLGELRPMIAVDIGAEEKDRFEAEVKAMREGLRDGKVSVTRVQPFLRSMRSAIADEKVSKEELEELTRVAHEAAKPAPKKR